MRRRSGGGQGIRSERRTAGTCACKEKGSAGETPTHFECNEDGCRKKVPREICKREIKRDEVFQMFTKGETEVLENFTSKAGKPFAATLYFKKSGRHGLSFRALGRKHRGRVAKCFKLSRFHWVSDEECSLLPVSQIVRSAPRQSRFHAPVGFAEGFPFIPVQNNTEVRHSDGLPINRIPSCYRVMFLYNMSGQLVTKEVVIDPTRSDLLCTLKGFRKSLACLAGCEPASPVKIVMVRLLQGKPKLGRTTPAPGYRGEYLRATRRAFFRGGNLVAMV